MLNKAAMVKWDNRGNNKWQQLWQTKAYSMASTRYDNLQNKTYKNATNATKLAKCVTQKAISSEGHVNWMG